MQPLVKFRGSVVIAGLSPAPRPPPPYHSHCAIAALAQQLDHLEVGVHILLPALLRCPHDGEGLGERGSCEGGRMGVTEVGVDILLPALLRCPHDGEGLGEGVL